MFFTYIKFCAVIRRFPPIVTFICHCLSSLFLFLIALWYGYIVLLLFISYKITGCLVCARYYFHWLTLTISLLPRLQNLHWGLPSFFEQPDNVFKKQGLFFVHTGFMLVIFLPFIFITNSLFFIFDRCLPTWKVSTTANTIAVKNPCRWLEMYKPNVRWCCKYC